MKDGFPRFRFIYRKLAGRAGKLILLSLLAIPLATWCALRVSMAIAVWRGNTLLLKVKQLRARESTYEDAMRLAHEYGSDVDFRGEQCSSKNCSFDISLGPGWSASPPFGYEMDFMRGVCIRVSWFAGSVQVRDGFVIGKGFEAWIEAKRSAPFGQWLLVSTKLTDRFPRCDYSYGRIRGLEEHPNYYVVHPHLTTGGGGQALRAEVTPDATPREIERAFDFRLSCVSSLVGCSEVGDLLPTAWEDYIALEKSCRRSEDAGTYGPCPLRTLARLARDMDNVLLVEVKRIFPVDRDQNRSQDVEFQLVEILKGQPDKHLARFPMDLGGDESSSTPMPARLPATIFSPGKRVVLFLRDSEIGFTPEPHCEVVPATQEYIGAVRQTLTQLSQGAPITALREGSPPP
jgi:hypothetical protein